MGNPVGPADNIQQNQEPRMPMNQIQPPDMQQMRQSLGSNFTEQEAMRDMQMRQLRQSLGANCNDKNQDCYKDTRSIQKNNKELI